MNASTNTVSEEEAIDEISKKALAEVLPFFSSPIDIKSASLRAYSDMAIKAIAKANEVIDAEVKRLNQLHHLRIYQSEISSFHIVASAFFAWVSDYDETPHPFSLGGLSYLGFANAVTASVMTEHALAVLADADVLNWNTVDSVKILSQEIDAIEQKAKARSEQDKLDNEGGEV